MKQLLTGIAVVAVVFTLASCARRGAPPSATPVVIPVPVPELVYYDNSGGIQDSIRLVVRDVEALREVWERATSTQSSPPPPPVIDFAREMVLVVGAGRMTPEDLVRMDSVYVREEPVTGNQRERFLEVIVHTIRGCQAFTSDAYPLAIVRTQRFDGTVRFVERRQRAEGCASSMLPVPGRSAR